MKIGLQTWGTDGDIRPFLALAGGLRSAGHDVTLVVTSADRKHYSDFAETLDINVVHAGNLTYNDHELRQFQQKVLDSWHFLQQIDIVLSTLFNPVIPEMFEAAERLCQENDVIIGHFMHHPAQASASVNRIGLTINKFAASYLFRMRRNNGTCLLI